MSAEAHIRTKSFSQTETMSTVELSYHIIDNAGAELTFDAAVSALPELGYKITVNGDQHSVTSRSCESVDSSLSLVWSGRITAEYSIASDFIPKDLNTSALNLDVWRVGANAPSNLNYPDDSDIDGTKVDQQGEAISIILPQQELTITNIRDDNNAAICRAAEGKRNSSAFQGATAGYVLFVGAQAKRISEEEYEITYKFVFDNYAHCRQVPLRGHDGRVDCTEGKATTVMWRQPFPATYDFNDMDIET